MKKLMNGVFGILLVAAVGAMPLQGMKSKAKKVEAPIERVIKGVSALDQIMDQVQLIVEFEDPTSLAHAKKQLSHLMNNKALNPKIKDVIKDDIEIINHTTDSSRKASQEAYDRLKVVAKQVEAQANVVAAIEEGAKLVKDASVDEKEEAIKMAQEKIKEAQEEQGWLQYLYTGAKRVITAPVNYVFGEESSKAKTAFYTTVGAAVLAAGGFAVGVQYGASSSDEAIKKPTSEAKNMPIAEVEKKPISEEEKQSFMDSYRKKYLDKLLGGNYNYLEDSFDKVLSRKDMNEIRKNSELVIKDLKDKLRMWTRLADKALLTQSQQGYQQADQERMEAKLFYNENVLPIRTTLISDGVIDLMDYLDWEAKTTGKVQYYD